MVLLKEGYIDLQVSLENFIIKLDEPATVLPGEQVFFFIARPDDSEPDNHVRFSGYYDSIDDQVSNTVYLTLTGSSEEEIWRNPFYAGGLTYSAPSLILKLEFPFASSDEFDDLKSDVLQIDSKLTNKIIFQLQSDLSNYDSNYAARALGVYSRTLTEDVSFNSIKVFKLWTDRKATLPYRLVKRKTNALPTDRASSNFIPQNSTDVTILAEGTLEITSSSKDYILNFEQQFPLFKGEKTLPDDFSQ